MTQRILPLLGTVPILFGALSGCDDGGGSLRVQVAYHESSAHLRASVTRELASGETLHLRLRQGDVTELDCAGQSSAMERIDERPVEDPFPGPTFEGPAVDATTFDSPYDLSWLEMPEPTEEMLAAIAQGNWVIDVCLMNGSLVVHQDSMDILQALDVLGPDGKFDGEPEEKIASPVAYAEACVASMGEIPFFAPIGEGDYATYNCLDSVPVPTTVTGESGEVTLPETQVSSCDNPQYIYSLCEPNAVSGRTNGPRVTSASNAQGTHWVLLCRKAQGTEGRYNDIAMIGHNPYTGQTCYFQNALYSRTDGLHVPHPADRIESTASPQESASLWKDINGGLGSPIACAECHDSDAFIHTPWIDSALNQAGDPVVPKMGVSEDFALGFNEAPYTILNSMGQGWTMPQQLVDEGASACTSCHRIGSGRWASSWITRLRGTDSSWTNMTTPAYRTFEHTFWMPPELEGLDAMTFPDSPYGRAMARIEECGDNPGSCTWAPLPAAQLVDPGEPPPIDLEGFDLALEAAKILGAQTVDPMDPRCTGPEGSCATRRCAECHSTSENGMRHWLGLTNQALMTCQLDRNPDELTQEEALRTVDCMRVDPADRSSVFAAERIGILTTGVQYSYFRKLFRKAFGDTWLPEYLRFRARLGMPKGSHPRLTQIEYATVLKWFVDGLPALDEVVQEAPPPSSCMDLTTPAFAAHVSEMELEGWETVNRDAGIRMFGCSGSDPLTCFASHPDRTPAWGNGTGRIREVTRLDFRTSFWTRSSADGRFVGNGGGSSSGATITDLQRGLDIGVQASYDPGFFPDNSGFIFQGGGAGICAQSILETDTKITFDEPGCMMASGINLYQHVARGVGGGGGGDYFIINSQFTSDAGNGNEDPSANFGGSATMKFSPMVFDGTNYTQLPEVIVDSPYEGDSVLSPSGRLVISRIGGPDGNSLGYSVRRVVATRTGENYRVSIDERLGTYCVAGAKANISFDERFFVTHRYEAGGANIYLTDMQTGRTTKITSFSDGSEARFPHFRSDGWFYFLVVESSGVEYVAASDAALVARGP